MTASLITSFVQKPTDSVSSLDTWAALEQQYQSNNSKTATLADLYAMRAYAQAGKSAFDYVQENCPYAVLVDEVLTVTLDFYVWVSSLDLNYQLTTDNGTISRASSYQTPKSFDVIFDHADSVNVGSLFTGSLTPQMPFFAGDGSQLDPPPTSTIDGANVRLSSPATTVLRANGIATGWRHTLTLTLTATDVHIIDKVSGRELDIIPGYALENLAASITCSWQDGGETKSNILQMDIPDCVEDLVTACDGDTRILFKRTSDDDVPDYIVQYSTCNGEILNEFWEDLDR